VDGLRTAVKFFSVRWLTEGVAEKLLYTPGLIHDAQIDALNQGILAGMGIGTNTALPLIGDDRKTLRGPAESEPAYRARLSQVWTAGRTWGGYRSLLSQLYDYLQLARVLRCISSSGDFWWVPAGDVRADDGVHNALRYRGTWDWDSSGQWWRIFVVIQSQSGTPWSPEGTWGDGQVWGDGGTWGSTATPNDVASVRSVVKAWKAQHAVAAWIIVSFDDTAFDPLTAGSTMPDGNWQHWSKVVSGEQVPSRYGSAVYWDGAT